MKTTGYKLKQSIQILEMQKASLDTEFEDALTAFKNESKRLPSDISTEIQKTEEQIALLQTAQARFNIAVTVVVDGQTMSLCQAIKMVGGAGRAEKRWKTLTKNQTQQYRSVVRDTNQEYASLTYTTKDALLCARRAAISASHLRAAVAEANSTEMEITGLDESLIQR